VGGIGPTIWIYILDLSGVIYQVQSQLCTS